MQRKNSPTGKDNDSTTSNGPARTANRRMKYLEAIVRQLEAENADLRRSIRKYLDPDHSIWKRFSLHVWMTKNRRKKRQKLFASSSARPPVFNFFAASPVGILCTRHTLFIARLIEAALKKIEIDSVIIFEKPQEGFWPSLHIVISPQAFSELPQLYVAFQVEQSTSDRWFSKQNLNALNHSYAILDYSIDNIAYLKTKGIPPSQIYYVPLAPIDLTVRDNEPPVYDVLFYGDTNSPRRKKIIDDLLHAGIRVKVFSNVFSDQLYKFIRKSKFVLNLHYYDPALLETTRVYECLSCGSLVISEKAKDQARHQNLEGVVHFVDPGDSDAIISFVRESTNHHRDQWKKRVAQFIAQDGWKFEFYFFRFLLAHDVIDFEWFCDNFGSAIRLPSDRVCLTLPEYPERLESFLAADTHKFEPFFGLRHVSPWIGCGLSYKFMSSLALKQGFSQLSICEDDVLFLDEFDTKFEKILEFLSHRDDWTLFAGVIADLSPQVDVLDVSSVDTLQLPSIDRFTSTVLNVYSRSALEQITIWDEHNREVLSNTIDRFLGSLPAMKVVTLIPWLVSHRVVDSTIWTHDGSAYNKMMESSLQLLRERVAARLALAIPKAHKTPR